MKEIFEKIWKLALPYQDKRDDKGHAKITLMYAKKLVKLENGNEDIVIPATILHDIGWSELPRESRFIIFNHKATKKQNLSVRYKHQEFGVKIGRKILHKIKYPPNKSKEILEIVSQHDTRDGFISKNEGLVRDADKLWRFSKTGFNADLVRNKFSPKFLYEKIKKKIRLPNFFYSESAKHIAHEELELRKSEFDGA